MSRSVALLTSLLFMAACAPEPSSAKAPPPPPASASPAPAAVPKVVGRHDPNAQILAPGAPVERRIKSKENHVYEVTLTEGQVFFATVEQRGVDLMVSLFDPEGKRLADVDSPNGTLGPEPIKIRAKTGGVYRVEVHPGEWPGYDAFAGKSEGAYQA